jgi:hypothetical protein
MRLSTCGSVIEILLRFRFARLLATVGQSHLAHVYATFLKYLWKRIDVRQAGNGLALFFDPGQSAQIRSI